MLGVPDEMMIFHELVGIFVEDSGKDFLWLLVEHKGVGIGCVLDNIRTSQHLFSGALVDGYFDSDIFGWGGFFISFYVRRGHGLFFYIGSVCSMRLFVESDVEFLL